MRDSAIGRVDGKKILEFRSPALLLEVDGLTVCSPVGVFGGVAEPVCISHDLFKGEFRSQGRLR